jgi:hypothetical protein
MKGQRHQMQLATTAEVRLDAVAAAQLSARRLHSGRLQIGIGGRVRLGQVAAFKSELAADIISESVADLRRN